MKTCTYLGLGTLAVALGSVALGADTAKSTAKTTWPRRNLHRCAVIRAMRSVDDG